MNKFLKIGFTAAFAFLLTVNAQAGNPDRAGQAGATQLLINPWARSSGWGGLNMAGITGVEAMSYNVGGIVNSRYNTDFTFARTSWLGGSSVNINAFGFTQKLGASKEDAFGVTITSFDFGEIPVTSVNQPEPTGATYSIQMMNIAVGYSHKFSDNISAGILVRGLSEGIPDVATFGLGLDAGVQYKSGVNDRIKFGVALRNVGPKMYYGGEGLAARAVLEGSDNSNTLYKGSAGFEMPSVLNIGGSYDLFSDSTTSNTFTIAGAYTSNAFSKDQMGLGLQYSYRGYLMARIGYVYEDGLFNSADRTTALSGPSAGMSFEIPFGKEKNRSFGIDYSFRANLNYTGTHSFGARLSL